MNYLKVPVKIVVAQVLKDAPATGVVKAEDIITSVDGKDVSEPGQVQELVRAKKPGDRMELGIERKGKSSPRKSPLVPIRMMTASLCSAYP